MNEEEVNKEIYSNLKYKIAPDEQDKGFEANLQSLRKDYFGRGEQGADGLPGHEQVLMQQKGKLIPLKSFLKWATGIAAVLVIGLFIWAPWNKSLYEQYAISRTVSVAERGDLQADLLSEAAEQYNSGNYASARALFAKAYDAEPADAMIAYYYAITLVETTEEEKGRTILAALYEGESVFKYDAAFYVALSYVKQDRKKEALEWLDKIPAGTTHAEAARKLRSEL